LLPIKPAEVLLSFPGPDSAYVAFGLSHPNHYKVTFMGAGHPGHMEEPNFAYQGSMGQKCFMHFCATVERCVQQGKFRPLDLGATSQALWATVHGITSLLITHPHFPWVNRDELVEQVIDVMTVGWKR
jgi:hypothetical protein